MLPDHQYKLVQKRAYEIYLSRDPKRGSPEEDWLRAEEEIEREHGFAAKHTGPARLNDRTRWNEVCNHKGEDIENPA